MAQERLKSFLSEITADQETENRRLQKRFEELEKMMTDLENIQKSGNNCRDRLIALLHFQLHTSNTRLKAKENDVIYLRSQLCGKEALYKMRLCVERAELDDCRTELDDCRTELDDCRMEKAELERELDKWKPKLIDLENREVELQKEIDTMKEKIGELQTYKDQVAQYKKKNAVLLSEVEKLKTKAETLDNTLKNRKAGRISGTTKEKSIHLSEENNESIDFTKVLAKYYNNSITKIFLTSFLGSHLDPVSQYGWNVVLDSIVAWKRSM